MERNKRERFDLVVELEHHHDSGEATGWLGRDGRKVDKLEDAVKFEFLLWPNGREEIQIQLRLDDLNGGIGQTVDLEQGIRNTHTAITKALEARLWPAGRPETTTQEEAREQAKLLAGAFGAIGVVPSEDEELKKLEKKRLAYDRMSELRDQQEMAASWPVLIVDPPPGWEDIAERDMSPGHRRALVRDYARARERAGQTSGK